MNTTTERTILASQGGEVRCSDHLGGYASMELKRRANAKRLETPLDNWTRMTATDRAEWIGLIREHYSDADETATGCEQCDRGKYHEFDGDTFGEGWYGDE